MILPSHIAPQAVRAGKSSLRNDLEVRAYIEMMASVRRRHLRLEKDAELSEIHL